MTSSRREMLLRCLFGAGLVGLRSLLTGVPMSFLQSPERALAQDACAALKKPAQFLILSTSDAGDPVNANVPGTYADARILHSPDPLMAKTSMSIGGKTFDAAKPWASLPPALLARTSFFHHATLTNAHPNQPKVMRLMGQTRRQEMFVSIYAKQLAACLGTVQREPVAVGARSSGELLSFDGRKLSNISPTTLKSVLGGANSPLANLRDLRDRDLDKLNALFKEHGTNVQRQYLDRVALSQKEARAIPEQLLENLADITSDGVDGQIIAATVLVKMKVAPVISLHIPFGGDNHSDNDFARETRETVAGVASIQELMASLEASGLSDTTTFALMNVFGRTLSSTGTKGRNHHPAHAIGIAIGKGIKGSVIGGLEPKGTDFVAQTIDAESGAGGAGGDIKSDASMGSLVKTLGVALGIDEAVLDEEVLSGKVVRAALA